ncbi:hypothetical protein HanRHA438_Chr04g0199121 [Helianthus annuus]|nr:hypothetical protein HanIR_Chr04g0204051 [Helianthus annuus]KAJ0928904.1 hypothetical protein HanRHA438_Chr04g0199121 [Helianthus annuus]
MHEFDVCLYLQDSSGDYMQILEIAMKATTMDVCEEELNKGS